MRKIQSILFQGFTDEDWTQLEQLSGIHITSYEKNERIFHMGDQIRELGVLLSGCIHIESHDLWGNKSILSKIDPGEIFAETYALCQEPMMVDVTAVDPCEVLFLNVPLLQNPSYRNTSWQTRLLSNLLQVSMQKNLLLSNRIFCTSPKTIRSRLLTYFSRLSVKCGSSTIQIPFNRQQLADYLNLDRSALSKELGKMQQDGLIEYHKNMIYLAKDNLYE